MKRLLIAVVALVAAVHAAQWKLRAHVTPKGMLELADDRGAAIADPEPIVRWEGAAPQAEGGELALNSSGLKAIIGPPKTGEYGEPVIAIDVRNGGTVAITGVLLPPFSAWRDRPETLRARSTQCMMLTAARVEFGAIGVHRSWSPGSEFDADVFATMPSLRPMGHVSAVLRLNAPPAEHEHERITLKPGESAQYELHLEGGDGNRNAALQEIYRVRGGYRVHPASYRFDAYSAPETSWVKNVTAVWMNWAWDKDNMDPRTGAWHLAESFAEAQRRFGGYDGYVLWPFWPRAGFDDRSQFDHYADLPGGITGLKKEIGRLHDEGVRVFISYCHWSESDRDSSDVAMARSYAAFAKLACDLNADGAVMDLMSKTPDEILDRARQCGRTLVPYNEGDPKWSDTQTNLLGRIHNDLPMPEFNLKRYMLPHHPQLRVCEPGNSGRRMRNDFVLSFFNGHGVEIGTVFPDNNPANDDDWTLLPRLLDLLRTHRANFTSTDWQPLIPTEDDTVWVNSWPAATSTVYTICGTHPGGHHGPLLRVSHRDDVHYVDLSRYRPLTPLRQGNDDIISYDVEGYVPGLGSMRGTADYSPGSIGVFWQRLRASLEFETLHVTTAHPRSDEHVELWLDTVRPGVEPVTLAASADAELDLYRQFGRHTNDALVLRLVDSTNRSKTSR